MRFAEAQSGTDRALRRLALIAACVLMSGTAAVDAAGQEPGAAQAAPVRALLHDDGALLDWLKQRRHEVLAADARIAQARADRGTAGLLLPNPQVDLTLGGLGVGSPNQTLVPTDVAKLGFGTTANFAVGLSQTIELGKRGPRMAAADLRVQGAGKSYLDNLGDRINDGRSALARVAYLKAKMALLEENLTGAKRVAELEKARLDHGALSGNDFDRLLLDNISLETDIARSRSDLASALAACQTALLAPCDAGAAELTDVDEAAPLPASVTSMVDAIEKRPDVQAVRLEGEAAKKDALLAERRAIPDPNVRVGFTHDNYYLGGNQPNSFQVTLTVPLPIFDHGQHDAAKARARALEQHHLAEAMISGARGDFSTLLSRKAFLEQTLKTLDSVAVPKSTNVLKTTSKAFDEGQVSMTDLLLARRTHLSLVLTQMDLHFEHFSVRNDLRHTLSLDTSSR